MQNKINKPTRSLISQEITLTSSRFYTGRTYLFAVPNDPIYHALGICISMGGEWCFLLLIWALEVNGNWGGGSRARKVIKKWEKRHHLYRRGVGKYWSIFRVCHAFCCLGSRRGKYSCWRSRSCDYDPSEKAAGFVVCCLAVACAFRKSEVVF